jgi:hypothetical protein
VRQDDNVRLTPVEEDDGLISSVTGQLRFRQATERSDVSALIGATYIDYSGVDLDNEDIEFLDFRGIWDTESGGSYGLRGTVRRDVLLRTADFLDDFSGPVDGGTDTIDDGGGIPDDDIDVGAVETQVRRVRTQVQPFANFNLGARSSLGVSYEYYANDYDEEPGTDVQDGQQHLVALELGRDLSEINSLRLRATAGRFEPDIDPEVDSYEIVAGLDRTFSEQFSGTIEVGARRAESGSESDNGMVFRVNGTRRMERGQFSASLERSLIPSAFGDMVERDTFRFGFYRQLTDRMAMSIDSRAYQINQSKDADRADRQYFEIEPRIERALSLSWDVGLSYRYRWVDREDEVSSAASNAVSIFLSYRPPRRI